jgi:cellulose synthase/poly-beta-1,6-N-acetylglucosamine synthase-like glycosyltransferase
LNKLGLPCQLMGSGMAFPWEIIRSADLSTGFIVEDLKLGLELAESGFFPKLCPEATVTSNFPNTTVGAKTQRQRWEHGQISLMLSKGVPLAASAIWRRNFSLLSLALDLLVPPITLFGLILAVATMVTALYAISGCSTLPFIICTSCLFTVTLGIGIAWYKFGRDILPIKSTKLLVLYFATKIGRYTVALFSKSVTVWSRTDRS